jgi:hypothetical protein
MEEGEQIIFVFDIEARGKSLIRNGILAVGVFVVKILSNGTMEVLYRHVFNVGPLPEQTYEEACLQNFWSKHPETQRKLEANPMDPQLFAKEFRRLLNGYDTCFLLCDNPSFDAAWINYYLDYFGYDSMSHDASGNYVRVVNDADSFTRGFFGAPPGTMSWVSNEAVAKELQISNYTPSNDHMPDEDALAILTFHIELVRHATIKK